MGVEEVVRSQSGGGLHEDVSVPLSELEADVLHERVFDAVPGGIVHVSAQGEILMANVEATRILGLRFDAESHRYVQDFAPLTVWEDGTPCVVEDYPVSRVLATGVAQPPVTIGVQRPDGETAWALYRALPVKDREGAVAGALVTFLDLTERRALEAQRGLLEAQLRESQRVESIGRLAGGIAHDFNNILTAIIANCDLIVGRSPGSAPPELADIRSAADRASGLIRQLLAYGRRQKLSPQAIDWRPQVAALSAMIRGLLGTHTRLDIRHDEDLWSFLADPAQLDRVLINLVSNARDAMPTGGEVAIRSWNLPEGEVADCRWELEAKDWVVLELSDTGCGIPEAELGQIFEPFYTTKPKYAGSGLGLSSVQGIVHQSGGRVFVRSQLGEGSSFALVFPRQTGVERSQSPPAESDRARVNISPQVPESEQYRLLLVEDDAMVRRVAQRILQQAGHAVFVAADADEAVACVEKLDAPLDLLVTDVVMPGLSGPELARKLRRAQPDLLVLLVSGYSHEALDHHSIGDENFELLQKPFVPSELSARVQTMLNALPKRVQAE